MVWRKCAVPVGPWGEDLTAGVFAVAKDEEEDRSILNRSRRNAVEARLDGVTPTAASGEPGITAGIDLGTPPGQEWGTYSYLQNLEISHLPNAIGVKLQVNVSVMINVWTEQTHDGILNHNGGCNLMAFGKQTHPR